jgi:hypothetical protein
MNLSAGARVQRPGVPFAGLYDDPDDACVDGLEAGKRWVDRQGR